MSYIGNVPLPQATEARVEVTATASQTSFTGLTYVENYLDVYLNGVKLASSDFTATDGTSCTLASGAAAGDIVAFVSRTQTSALVALPLKDSAGNNVLSESGGTVTLGNATLASNNTFPAIGQLAAWHGATGTSASITFTLDGVSSYTIIGLGRYESDPYGPHTLSFIIDSSNGTISNKTDNWGNSFNESFNNSTKVLTITTDSSHSVLFVLIYKGAVTEGT